MVSPDLVSRKHSLYYNVCLYITEVTLGNTGCTTLNGVTDSCADLNAVCGSGNKCVCKTGYYDNNGDSELRVCRLSKFSDVKNNI